MFEEKVAQNPVYQYTETNQQAWMEAIRDYLIGRHLGDEGAPPLGGELLQEED